MTLDQAIALRDAAQVAYLQALQARSVGYGDKSVTRQDLAALSREFDRWQRVVNDMQRASIGSNIPTVAAVARWSQ